MPPGSQLPASPPDPYVPLTAQLRRLLEDTTMPVLRQGARLWGWPLKGNAKVDLVEQLMGYLTDAKRMPAAFQALPPEEAATLGWLAALQLSYAPARSLQTALALSGHKLTQGAIGQILQQLQARLLVFVDIDSSYDMPDLFRQWLPPLSAPGLRAPGRPPQFRAISLAEIDQHAQYLLAAVQGERPEAHLAPPPSQPSGRIGAPANPPNAARPSLVAAEVLHRWGYAAGEQHHLARFLLEQLTNVGICTVVRQRGKAWLQVEPGALEAWHAATPAQRLGLLRSAAIAAQAGAARRLGSWTLVDLALEHVQGYTLRPYHAYSSQDLPTESLFLLSLWLLSVTSSLEADTWYGIPQLLELLYAAQRDLLLEPYTYNMWRWHQDNQPLDPNQMSRRVWQETYGRMVEAWLAGPASWLLLVQVGTLNNQPVAFRRQSTVEAGAAPPVPRNALRFAEDGTAVLQNSWQTGELRRLLSRIATEVSRSAETTLFRLDAAAFRRTLQSNLSPAQVAEEFAAAGFPPPPGVRETLRLWQERSGRYQLYDNLAVVELGEDLLATELQAVVARSGVEFYAATPRCLIILDPAQVPALVEELRRRGHTPQVLP